MQRRMFVAAVIAASAASALGAVVRAEPARASDASARRRASRLAVEIINGIGPGFPNSWATVQVRVNRRYRGQSQIRYHQGIRPIVRPGASVLIRVHWQGQYRRIRFTAKHKPERIRFSVRRGRLVLRHLTR